jgi:hypothetical protein
LASTLKYAFDVASTYKYEFEEETEAAEGLATTPKSERPLPKCQRQRKDLQQKVKKSKLKDQVSFNLGEVEISKAKDIIWLILFKASLNDVTFSEMLSQVNTFRFILQVFYIARTFSIYF